MLTYVIAPTILRISRDTAVGWSEIQVLRTNITLEHIAPDAANGRHSDSTTWRAVNFSTGSVMRTLRAKTTGHAKSQATLNPYMPHWTPARKATGMIRVA